MGRFGWGLREDGENNYIIINDLVVGGAVCCWLLSSNDCRLRTVATFFIVCAGLMSGVEKVEVRMLSESPYSCRHRLLCYLYLGVGFC